MFIVRIGGGARTTEKDGFINGGRSRRRACSWGLERLNAPHLSVQLACGQGMPEVISKVYYKTRTTSLFRSSFPVNTSGVAFGDN